MEKQCYLTSLRRKMNELISPETASALKKVFNAIVLYGGFALLGGVIKIAFGIQNGESFLNATIKYGLVCLPMGVLCGWGAESLNINEVVPFAAAFLAGHASYNIVTNIELKTSTWLLQLLSGGKIK